MAGEKVLIVDDDEDIREVLLDRLGSMGYETIGAADGKQGLEAIRRESPDVVFLDIRMPQMDGFEVLAQLGKERQEAVAAPFEAAGYRVIRATINPAVK